MLKYTIRVKCRCVTRRIHLLHMVLSFTIGLISLTQLTHVAMFSAIYITLFLCAALIHLQRY